jgi:WD40 repeat protein
VHTVFAVIAIASCLTSSAQSAEVWGKDLGQQGGVCATFSPDGLVLAMSGGRSGDIALWNPKTRVKVANLKSQAAQRTFHSIMFSPDGTTIATWDVNSNIIDLWDVATRTLRATAKGRDSDCKGVCFSPDSKWLIGGTEESKDHYRNPYRVAVWDTQTGKLQHMLTHSSERSVLERDRLTWTQQYDVAISPDGKWVLSANNGQVGIRDPALGLKGVLKASPGAIVYGVDISRDGKMWAYVSTQGAFLWKQVG